MVIRPHDCPLIKLHSGNKENELTSIHNIKKQADKGNSFASPVFYLLGCNVDRGCLSRCQSFGYHVTVFSPDVSAESAVSF